MSQRFQPEDTAIPGLTLLTRSRFGDERGFLSRLFCGEELAAFGWPGPVLQVNETGTAQKALCVACIFNMRLLPSGNW